MQQPQAPLQGVISGGPMFASVDIVLRPNEQVLADAASMTWKDEDIKIETDCHGGCGQSFCRACANESCCLNTYTGPGRVGFAFDLPGDMLPFAVNPNFGWILSRGAFICGTPNIDVSSRFAGCFAACCSGEGPFLTKVTCKQGDGLFYAGGFGSIVRHDIPPGQVFFVDNGLFFAANDQTKLQIGMVGNFKSTLCSGEGLVMKFYGPCTIFTQSRDPSIFEPPNTQQQSGGSIQ